MGLESNGELQPRVIDHISMLLSHVVIFFLPLRSHVTLLMSTLSLKTG